MTRVGPGFLRKMFDGVNLHGVDNCERELTAPISAVCEIMSLPEVTFRLIL